MGLVAERVEVWAARIKDEVGGLEKVLAGLQNAGADLDFMLARRTPDVSGEGVVFVTPLREDAEITAAKNLGFNMTNSVHSVRIEGDNKPGVAAKVTKILAEAGINLRGFSAAAIGSRFIFYIGLDSSEDAAKAVEILQ